MHPYLELWGEIRLPVYGLMMVAGALSAIGLACFFAKRKGLEQYDVLLAAIFCFLGGLLGAKMLYIIIDIPNYISYFSVNGFSFWMLLKKMANSGIVFYGGLIGGFVGGWAYTRFFRLDFWSLGDALIPWLPLGHGFGRIGCFFAGCCYGRVTDSSIGVVFSAGNPAAGPMPRLPVQLFEAGFCFAVLLPAMLMYSRKERKPGQVIGLYLTLYSVFRFIIEFYRGDAVRGVYDGISTSQIVSLVLLPMGIILLFGWLDRLRPTRPALVTPEGIILSEDDYLEDDSAEDDSVEDEGEPDGEED